MKTTQLKIPSVTLIEPDVYHDERGRFSEIFNISKYPRMSFMQSNISISKAFTIRGLHLQAEPHAQAKLVQCVRGSVFDVAVDLRPGSSTFGKWVGEYLCEKDHKQLLIPAGFAHGFQALEEDTTFVYMCSDVYNKEAERSIRWDDPDINVRWPYINEALIGEKDQKAESFANYKKGLEI